MVIHVTGPWQHQELGDLREGIDHAAGVHGWRRVVRAAPARSFPCIRQIIGSTKETCAAVASGPNIMYRLSARLTGVDTAIIGESPPSSGVRMARRVSAGIDGGSSPRSSTSSETPVLISATARACERTSTVAAQAPATSRPSSGPR